MKESVKVLQEKMVRLVSDFPNSRIADCGGILSAYFNNLSSSRSVAREVAYDFLNGFIWSMFCMGIIDCDQRLGMIADLNDLVDWEDGGLDE